MRKATIYYQDKKAGWLSEDENGFHFVYAMEYLQQEHPTAISLTLPLQVNTFDSNILFPFFDGLIPEGWLLDLVETNWKLNARDRMGLLLACCRDCIGAVGVEPLKESDV